MTWGSSTWLPWARSAFYSLRTKPFLPIDLEGTPLSVSNDDAATIERDTQMHVKLNSKCVLLALSVLVVLFFCLGASRIVESDSDGRYQLVVKRPNSRDVFVIDTATGQVWTNRHSAPDEARKGLYEAKRYQGQ